MQPSFKEMTESQDYANQKAILFNAINRTQKVEFSNGSWYAPASSIPYIDRTMHVDTTVFKKSKEEKELLKEMKKELGKTKHHKFVLWKKITL